MNSQMISLEASWGQLLAEHNECCALSHPAKDLDASVRSRFQLLLDTIEYKDWHLCVHQLHGSTLIQLMTMMPDILNGKPIANNSRMLPICPNMSDGFIVDLAFELIKEFELHEAGERFKLMGVRVYYPHDPFGRPVRNVRSVRSRPRLPTALSKSATIASEAVPLDKL